jgi:hypothetical protein
MESTKRNGRGNLERKMREMESAMRRAKIEEKVREMEWAESRAKSRAKMDIMEKLWVEEIIPNWEKLWKQADDARSGSVWNMFQRRPMLDIYIAEGVPPNKRGEVWIRLMSISEVLCKADVDLYDELS